MAAKRNPEEIQRMLEGYRQSGMKRVEYCRSQGIPVTTLDYYLHRQSLQARPRLAKVTVVTAEAAEQARSFALVLRNGRRIESGWNFQEGDLARLIRVAEAL
jgi:UDP-N-acetylmuramoylalanine-D-glutamate ligase